jgi:D-aspartate ligase
MAAAAPALSAIALSPVTARLDAGTRGALVMGADYRGLGIVRSLGRRGIPVWVVKNGGHLVAATSRYGSRRVPWPAGDDQSKIDYLLDLGARHGLNGWVLFPTDDYSVSLVAQNHEMLAKLYRLTVPPWNQLQWACDKRLLHCLAARLSIPQPWTACPRSRRELAELDCPFPVILKPAVRLTPTNLSTPKAWPAQNRESLLTQYEEASSIVRSENLFVQEVVPGDGRAQFSYAALCNEGTSLAWLVAQRARQFPRDFGQLSTYVETVHEPRLVESATRLLSATRYTGLVEIEFKEDLRDGQFKLLDVNPRVWGWHTLSRKGIDFPYLLWQLLKGEPIPRLTGRPGQRWMHFSADVRVAIEEILRHRLSLGEYLRSFRGPREGAIFSWDDPLPGLLDLPLFLWTALKRASIARNH